MGMSDYGLYDEDGELRFVYPSIGMALDKTRDLGWGYVYKIKVKKIGKELR